MVVFTVFALTIPSLTLAAEPNKHKSLFDRNTDAINRNTGNQRVTPDTQQRTGYGPTSKGPYSTGNQNQNKQMPGAMNPD